MRELRFNFTNIIKVAAFIVASFVLHRQVCRQRLIPHSVKSLIARFLRSIPRIAGNKIVIWHPHTDCLAPYPLKKKGKLTEWAAKWKVGVTYCCTHIIE